MPDGRADRAELTRLQLERPRLGPRGGVPASQENDRRQDYVDKRITRILKPTRYDWLPKVDGWHGGWGVKLGRDSRIHDAALITNDGPVHTVGLDFDRGMVGAAAGPLRVLAGWPCETCGGSGEVLGNARVVTCDVCRGLSTGLLPPLCAAAPLTRAAATDADARYWPRAGVVHLHEPRPSWFSNVDMDENDDHDPNWLPWRVARRLGMPSTRPQVYGYRRLADPFTRLTWQYTSSADANDALSAALLGLGRAAAGLPPLPGDRGVLGATRVHDEVTLTLAKE